MGKSRKWITCLLMSGISFTGQAQQPVQWTLKECIDYALERNVQVRKSRVALEESYIDTRSAKAQLFPDLSFSIGQDLVNTPYPQNAGISRNNYTGSYGLRSSWTLFEGGKRLKTIEQQKKQNQVAAYAVEEAQNRIELAIIEAYLQILYAEESVRIDQNTVEVSDMQRKRAAELLAAGSIARSDYAQMESQYSRDKYQLVVAQTALEEMKLKLKQLLELDSSDEIGLSAPVLEEDDILYPLPSKTAVYETALRIMPEIGSGRVRIEVAELETQKAKTGYSPVVSLNAAIGSGNMSGSGYNFPHQLKFNLSESIGLTLSVPLFDRRETRSAVQKARFQQVDSELDLYDAKKELLNTVESVWLDASSSQEQYVSALENLKAVEESYRLVNEQFGLGMKNTLDLLTEKNNLLSARQELLQAKYMAVLNRQLLNFYQDLPIGWND